MREVFEKIVEKLEACKDIMLSDKDHDCFGEECKYQDCTACTFAKAIEIVKQEAAEYNDGWIPCSERLPECENKYGWVSCIVSVIRSHYPTSTYDICDSPYDENIVMHANYHVSQKIWHLECDEQLNALINIDNSTLNGDYVIAWQPLPDCWKGE